MDYAFKKIEEVQLFHVIKTLTTAFGGGHLLFRETAYYWEIVVLDEKLEHIKKLIELEPNTDGIKFGELAFVGAFVSIPKVEETRKESISMAQDEEKTNKGNCPELYALVCEETEQGIISAMIDGHHFPMVASSVSLLKKILSVIGHPPGTKKYSLVRYVEASRKEFKVRDDKKNN